MPILQNLLETVEFKYKFIANALILQIRRL